MTNQRTCADCKHAAITEVQDWNNWSNDPVVTHAVCAHRAAGSDPVTGNAFRPCSVMRASGACGPDGLLFEVDRSRLEWRANRAAFKAKYAEDMMARIIVDDVPHQLATHAACAESAPPRKHRFTRTQAGWTLLVIGAFAIVYHLCLWVKS